METQHEPIFIYFRDFTEQMLGSKYVENRPIELSKTFEESSKAEPIFFILSPGLDPLTDVEALGMMFDV